MSEVLGDASSRLLKTRPGYSNKAETAIRIAICTRSVSSGRLTPTNQYQLHLLICLDCGTSTYAVQPLWGTKRGLRPSVERHPQRPGRCLSSGETTHPPTGVRPVGRGCEMGIQRRAPVLDLSAGQTTGATHVLGEERGSGLCEIEPAEANPGFRHPKNDYIWERRAARRPLVRRCSRAILCRLEPAGSAWPSPPVMARTPPRASEAAIRYDDRAMC
jgi:hypothetical protein